MNPKETKLNRNFDVLKYDGIKALKIGKNTYAIRCFNEALKLKGGCGSTRTFGRGL